MNESGPIQQRAANSSAAGFVKSFGVLTEISRWVGGLQ